jgi:starch synthase
MLLCVGRIDPIKNQAWLLDQAPAIFQRHPNALLALAGPCTDEPYGELIDRKIKELGLQERVLLTGGLPPNDPRLIGLMQESSALLLPSLSETFGLVILEAWAAGTVVVSSRTSGPSALDSREGKRLVVQPGSSRCLSCSGGSRADRSRPWRAAWLLTGPP